MTDEELIEVLLPLSEKEELEYRYFFHLNGMSTTRLKFMTFMLRIRRGGPIEDPFDRILRMMAERKELYEKV